VIAAARRLLFAFSRRRAAIVEGKIAGFAATDQLDQAASLLQERKKTTVFAAAICSRSTRRDATEAMLGFLASADADAAKRRHGMAPARRADADTAARS